MRETGLSKGQIYKWQWDKFRKLRDRRPFVSNVELVCTESLPLNALEVDFLKIQRSYKLSVASVAVKQSILGCHEFSI